MYLVINDKYIDIVYILLITEIDLNGVFKDMHFVKWVYRIRRKVCFEYIIM